MGVGREGRNGEKAQGWWQDVRGRTQTECERRWGDLIVTVCWGQMLFIKSNCFSSSLIFTFYVSKFTYNPLTSLFSPRKCRWGTGLAGLILEHLLLVAQTWTTEHKWYVNSTMNIYFFPFSLIHIHDHYVSVWKQTWQRNCTQLKLWAFHKWRIHHLSGQQGADSLILLTV